MRFFFLLQRITMARQHRWQSGPGEARGGAIRVGQPGHACLLASATVGSSLRFFFFFFFSSSGIPQLADLYTLVSSRFLPLLLLSQGLPSGASTRCGCCQLPTSLA